MSPQSNQKTSTWSAVNFKKPLDLDELLSLEPAVWSCDTGQRIPCFDRCQLIIIWISNTKEVHSKPRLHVSLSNCYLEYGCHVARLYHRCRRRHVYTPTSNFASHDNHEKINSWVSFCFPYMGCLWGSAWQPFRPPELRYYICSALTVRPGSRRSRSFGGYSLANRKLYACIFHQRKLGSLLTAPAGASKRETPTSNLTESTAFADYSL